MLRRGGPAHGGAGFVGKMSELREGGRDSRNITHLGRAFCQELHKVWLFPLWFFRRPTPVGRGHFFKSFAFAFDADFHVLAGCFDVGMPEPVFDDGDVVSRFNQMKRCRMAKHMRGNPSVLE